MKNNLFYVKYNPIWGRIYVFSGIIFLIIFLLAYYTLNDSSMIVNLILAIIPLLLGINMLKYKYMAYSKEKILVYSSFGRIKHEYLISKGDSLFSKNKKIYLKKGNSIKKLKVNSWFVDLHDWERFKKYFIQDEENHLLEHFTED